MRLHRRLDHTMTQRAAMLGRMHQEPFDFNFDFIAPYGWFASRRIDAMTARHGRSVNWHSMLLGVTVLKVMGLRPSAVPRQGRWRRERRAAFLPVQG